MSTNLLTKKICFESVHKLTIDSMDSLMDQMKKHFENASIFALFKNKALFGKYEDGKLSFNEDYPFTTLKMIEEMRIFNGEKELYLYRKNDELLARLREDCETGEGKEREYVCSKIALWGTEGKTSGDWTILSEDRGISLRIPFVPKKRVDESHPVFIVVHSYIEYLDGVQASYCDSRFVRFAEGGAADE